MISAPGKPPIFRYGTSHAHAISIRSNSSLSPERPDIIARLFIYLIVLSTFFTSVSVPSWEGLIIKPLHTDE